VRRVRPGELASIGRLHIVAIGALGALTFGWTFTGRYLGIAAGFCALDWFIVNLVNRIVDLPEDRANGIVGTALVARRRRALMWLAGGGLAASLALTLAVAPALTPYRIGFHLVGAAYNWPLLPGGRRIKQLFVLKNLASGLGFLLTAFVYPLVLVGGDAPLAPGISSLAVGLTGLYFLLFELSYEAIYDLRDAHGDALAGVRTYAVVLGPRAAVRVIDAHLVASVLVLVVGYAGAILPWRVLVFAIGPLVQAVAYKRALRRGLTQGDCVTLTWIGVGLLLAYHAWIALDLPGIA
jgi:4-hydroxybenzoate polyprenyltransferase